MELADVIRRRRMVRRFDPDRLVPPAVLDSILHSAVRAPSAGFSQGSDFVVLHSPEDVRAFWSATSEEPHARADPDPLTDRRARWRRGVSAAPVLVLCCSDKNAYLRRYAEPDKGWTDMDEGRWPVPYWDLDTAMAALLMLLSAVDEGVGALFFGVPPEHHDDVRTRFGIPAERALVGVVALGYELEPATPGRGARSRRPFAEVVHFGRFSG